MKSMSMSMQTNTAAPSPCQHDYSLISGLAMAVLAIAVFVLSYFLILRDLIFCLYSKRIIKC